MFFVALGVAGAAAGEPTPAPTGAPQAPSRAFPADRTCSAIDPAYLSVAEETGGLVLPLSGATLAANAARIGALLAARLDSVDLVRGTLDAGIRRIEAPVDAGVTKLVVSLCVDDEKEIALVDPNGRALPEDDPASFVLREGRHRIFVVDSPGPGDWTVRVRGSGRYLAWVKVEGGIGVGEADAGAASEIPVAGEPEAWRLRLSPAPREARLALVDGDGAWIAEAALARDGDLWTTRLQIPEKPFRIQVSGREAQGNRFRRTLPRLWRPVSGNGSAMGGS